MKKDFRLIFETIEGKLLIAAFLTFFALLGGISLTAFYNPSTAKTLSLAFVAHTLGGRAAGIGICIAMGFGNTVTILYNMFLEILIVLFSYSVFVLSIRHYINSSYINTAAKNAAAKAVKYEKKIASYGIPGLFLFVMIPLPVTGPVIGSIIGYFIGLSIKKNFAAVFCGTFSAIAMWTLLFNYIDTQQLNLLKIVLAIMLASFVIYHSKSIKDWFTKTLDD